jgi:hypothetical protein
VDFCGLFFERGRFLSVVFSDEKNWEVVFWAGRVFGGYFLCEGRVLVFKI